jgi:hypothetical protein
MARLTSGESSEPGDPDGLMNDQEMPTADGQMASNTSEELIPPSADRSEDPSWGADSGNGGPGVSGHDGAERDASSGAAG